MSAASSEPLLWVKNGQPTAQALEMRQALTQAELHGLPAAGYRSTLSDSELQSVALSGAGDELLKRYDSDLSRLTARFVTHLRYGRISARAAGFDLPVVTNTSDSAATATRRLAVANNIEAELASLEPHPAPYRLLKQTLARYRHLAQDRTIRPLPALPGRTVRAGDEYAGAMQLRQHLLALGDLPANHATSNSATLDAALVEALKHFQGRHGLAVDGALGKQTMAALNVPMNQRVRQIELSMERWRWLSALPRPEIVINIPQFMLYALPRPSRPHEQLLEMPVIVGRPKHRTPVFTAAIEEVIFNPYWDVPSSIMRNELLPKIRKDARYLERNHFEIVRGGGDDARVQPPTQVSVDGLAAGQFRLRQRPGPDNALGPVKFVLPNPYTVRLHGTAEPHLFTFAHRAFSHGCIRVSDPAALAEYVLVNAPGNWDAEAVETAMCGTQPRRIKLNAPVRVIVFYATAAATMSRGVMFSPDLYGHDARLEKLLASATPSS